MQSEADLGRKVVRASFNLLLEGLVHVFILLPEKLVILVTFISESLLKRSQQ